MADFLVKILMECGQPIPDFLESFKPADEKLDFDDDSGAEEEEGGGDVGGDSWGAGGGAVNGAGDDGW